MCIHVPRLKLPFETRVLCFYIWGFEHTIYYNIYTTQCRCIHAPLMHPCLARPDLLWHYMDTLTRKESNNPHGQSTFCCGMSELLWIQCKQLTEHGTTGHPSNYELTTLPALYTMYIVVSCLLLRSYARWNPFSVVLEVSQKQAWQTDVDTNIQTYIPT